MWSLLQTQQLSHILKGPFVANVPTAACRPSSTSPLSKDAPNGQLSQHLHTLAHVIPSAWNLLSPFFRRQVFILKDVSSFQQLNATSLGHRVRPLFLCASLAESWGYTANVINIHQDIQAPPLSDTEDYTVPLFCSQDAWLALATENRVRLINLCHFEA